MNKDKHSLFLCIAVAAEITATMLLTLSRGMSVLLPTILALSSYAAAYYFLTLSLKRIPLGLAYALWAGAGIVMTSTINFFLFNISLSPGGFIGVTMIVTGVLIINLLANKGQDEKAVEVK
ncbi:DMT family transporter [Erwinia sp. CGal63]|uniref:DMT family transporter n=1 Tax=Erwinia sp. CGal63 TaxID=2919889 RepID=UPI00300957BC